MSSLLAMEFDLADWIEFAYPQLLPDCPVANPVTQARLLAAINVQPRDMPFSIATSSVARIFCGSGLTIADYLGSFYVAIAEWVSFDLTLYGNVLRWMSTMKARASWEKVHGDWNAMKASLRPSVYPLLAKSRS
jgi:hypothetical protein